MHELGGGTCNEETRGVEGTRKASPAREEAEEKEEVTDSRNILQFRAAVPWWSAVVGVKDRSDLGDSLVSGLNTWVERYFCLDSVTMKTLEEWTYSLLLEGILKASTCISP